MPKRTLELTVSEARERLADLIIEVAFRDARVILHRHRRRLVALVSIEDLERLRRLDAAEAATVEVNSADANRVNVAASADMAAPTSTSG